MSDPVSKEHLIDVFKKTTDRIKNKKDLQIDGKLVRMVGVTLEAVGCKARVGSRCLIYNGNEIQAEAEVIGFDDEKVYLMATRNVRSVLPGSRVVPSQGGVRMPVGDHLLGRIIDGAGNPLDGGVELTSETSYPLQSQPFNPLQRVPIKKSLDVGIRALNGLLTIGRGQRIGLFAGSGLGKSVLLGMMTRFTSADVIVVGLIGERGREVKEFIEDSLGREGLERSVIVASPADQSPLMRSHAALRATTIAEYFRDQGKNVLLLMDSLTRYAQALREISLALGEPPATKGYTPSVFSKLSQIVERAGTSTQGGGSITAFYTVLAEGDDQQDPIVDSARSILDGHIVLSRDLAEAGHYPAIDVESSISRVLPAVTSEAHQKAIRFFRRFSSKYRQNQDLITVGAYSAGSDRELDLAIRYLPILTEYLQQGMNEQEDFDASLQKLIEITEGIEGELND